MFNFQIKAFFVKSTTCTSYSISSKEQYLYVYIYFYEDYHNYLFLLGQTEITVRVLYHDTVGKTT